MIFSRLLTLTHKWDTTRLDRIKLLLLLLLLLRLELFVFLITPAAFALPIEHFLPRDKCRSCLIIFDRATVLDSLASIVIMVDSLIHTIRCEGTISKIHNL